MNTVRTYNLMYAAMLLGTSILAITGREFGAESLPPVDNILGFALALSCLLTLIAIVRDDDTAYKLSYTITNVVLGWWLFTLAAYAAYNIVSWGGVITYTYILISYAYIEPYLLVSRAANTVINDAARRASDKNNHDT